MQRQQTNKPYRMRDLRARYGLFKNAPYKKQGNTDLHELARSSESPQELRYFIDHQPTDTIIRMAKTHNNMGELPLDITLRRPVDSETEHKRRRVMAEMLFSPTVKNQLKPLRELLTENEVLKRYRHDHNPRLNRNLLLARTAVNAVRALNIKSATHPDADMLTQAEKEQLRDEVRNARQYIGSKLMTWWPPFDLPPDQRSQYVAAESTKIKQLKLGNCGEYAVLLANEILQEHADIQVDIYGIRNGDHVFVVIDRDVIAKEDDFQTWGEHAVVCDAWAGKVYAARDLPKYLGDYHEWYIDETNETVQVVSGFNPNYHQLRLRLSIASQTNMPRSTINNNF